MNEKRPEAITLRVKERHYRERTYTVVDTAQPSINGTHFDPANPLDSTLGKKDPSNPYYKEEPVKFDYVKK